MGNINNSYDHIPLDVWLQDHHSVDDLRTVFLNMDRALKYIHEHNYCIEVFHPSAIEILNNEIDHIQFKYLIELPFDPHMREQMIKEDIFNSSLIQIGIYSNCLKNLTPEFLKENFDEFTIYLPADDSPYYRGVVQRGATIYFCEFAIEKRNRDLAILEQQLGEDSHVMRPVDDVTNEKVNDKIYRQINGLDDTAFINYLIIPTIIITVLVLFSIIVWFGTLIK